MFVFYRKYNSTSTYNTLGVIMLQKTAVTLLTPCVVTNVCKYVNIILQTDWT